MSEEYETQIVNEILDKLNGEFSVDFVVDNLFKTVEINKIESILQNVKKSLMQKNECIKGYLNENQSQLLSCSDLIDSLNKFSDFIF